jgi:HEAT repeat protein
VYRCAVPLILLLLLMGCNKDTTPSKNPANDGTKPKLKTDDKVVNPTPLEHKGVKLDDWAEALMKGPDGESQHAAKELGEVGEPALPYFIKAMDSEKDYVKIHSLEQLREGKAWAKKHPELVPVLNKALKDTYTKVRLNAAETIVVLDFPDSIAALRQRAEGGEPDINAREKMLAMVKK